MIFILKIRSIIIKVISKLFLKFLNIEKFSLVYQKTYNKIVSQLANKNK